MIWDASDANPMHRRIPAEVVSRRRPVEKRTPKPVQTAKQDEPEDVIVDLKAAIALKPESRPNWLRKAVKMVTDGKASSTDLYNIVVSRKFASGLPDRVARRLIETIKDSAKLFSDNQQRYLSSSDCPLMASQKREDPEPEADEKVEEKAPDEKVADEKADSDAEEPPPPPPDEKVADEKADSDAEEPPPPPPERKTDDEVVSKARVSIEQRATRTFDEVREERMRDRDAERARERERDKERERARREPGTKVEESAGSKWQAALDEAAQRRSVIDAEQVKRRESAREFRQQRMSVLADEASKPKPMDEAATRKKLEEEADDLLMNALLGGGNQNREPPPPVQLKPAGNGRRRERSRSRSISVKVKKKRSRSGSRSISSRAARKLARRKPKNDRPNWRQSAPGDYLTGSRALLTGTYVEDLPHLPRPANAPPVGRARKKSRSRSNTRFF